MLLMTQADGPHSDILIRKWPSTSTTLWHTIPLLPSSLFYEEAFYHSKPAAPLKGKHVCTQKKNLDKEQIEAVHKND